MAWLVCCGLRVAWGCSQDVGLGCCHLIDFLGLEDLLLWWFTHIAGNSVLLSAGNSISLCVDLSVECLHMIANFPQSHWWREGKTEPSGLLRLSLKSHIVISVRSYFVGRGWLKDVNIRKWESLGAILMPTHVLLKSYMWQTI